jgi:hypothetical protein
MAYELERTPVVGIAVGVVLAARGIAAQGLRSVTSVVGDAADVAVPAVANALLSRIDLNALVRDHVDIGALIADVDIAAVLRQMDLVALTREIIAEVDLPAIIRESTASVTSEAVRGVRMQGVEADQAVARLVDRVLLRRPARHIEPAEAGSNGQGSVVADPH